MWRGVVKVFLRYRLRRCEFDFPFGDRGKVMKARSDFQRRFRHFHAPATTTVRCLMITG